MAEMSEAWMNALVRGGACGKSFKLGDVDEKSVTCNPKTFWLEVSCSHCGKTVSFPDPDEPGRIP